MGTGTAVRVATFNILNGRDPADAADAVVDVTTFGDAVRELDADVLALQEVDRNQPRSQGTDLTAVAAHAMGATDHRFVAAMAGSPGTTWVGATGSEQPDAAAYGVALLSRLPVTAWQVVRLPHLRAPVPMRFRGHPLPTWVRDEARVAVVATVQTDGGPVTAVCTHLSFVPWWNRRQLRSLTTAVAGNARPLVLMGDLNMGVAAAVRATAMTPGALADTFPADAPREQLDHVLLDGPVTVTSGRALRLPLSDHRALTADLTLG